MANYYAKESRPDSMCSSSVESLDPHFLHKDASDARGVDYVLTLRRLGSTLPASTCASERALTSL